jgi:hypothetical protein
MVSGFPGNMGCRNRAMRPDDIFIDTASEHVRNIRQYSAYLEEKVLAYRELHVDYVKSTANGKGGRLRRLPVSQGLLRETSILQRQIAGLLKCQVQ